MLAGIRLLTWLTPAYQLLVIRRLPGEEIKSPKPTTHLYAVRVERVCNSTT